MQKWVRDRWGVAYSRVGLQWTAAGAVPTAYSNDLYARAIGETDAVLGVLDLSDTSILSPGRLDTAQRIECFYHGFRIFVHTPASVSAANQALAIQRALMFTAGRLQVGRENEQDYGRIVDSLLQMPSIQVAGGQGQIATQSDANGARALDKSLKLGAGSSIRMPLTLSARVGLPAGVGLEDLELAVEHTFYGRTDTAVEG